LLCIENSDLCELAWQAVIAEIIEETFYNEPPGGEDERMLRTDRRGDRVTLMLADPEQLNPLTAVPNMQLQNRLEESRAIRRSGLSSSVARIPPSPREATYG
jgi:hypothetical protein